MHHALQGRELGERRSFPQLPRPNSGILVLDDSVSMRLYDEIACGIAVSMSSCRRPPGLAAAATAHLLPLPAACRPAGRRPEPCGGRGALCGPGWTASQEPA